eukprot:5728581-Pyramimonas_sp.AAC.1
MGDETKPDPARVDGSMFQPPPAMNGLPRVEPSAPTADKVPRFASDNPIRVPEVHRAKQNRVTLGGVHFGRRCGATTDPEDGG